MNKYLFLLGSTPDLSFAELSALFPDNLARFSREAAILQTSENLAADFIGRLGGTVKIGQIFATFSKDIDSATLQQTLVEHFLQSGEKKIHFAIGEIGRDQLERFDLISLKDALQDSGLKVRFDDRSRSGASAALLLHRQRLHEVLLVQGQEELILAQTLQVQNIDDWSLRDRQKPYADHKKGMLPPKLARMMVNLAVGTQNVENTTLYDPFCGSGTVLLEAAFAPFAQLIASDLDVRAVLGAKENFAWWEETYSLSRSAQFFTSDVTKVTSDMLARRPINFIVTEPFLGKQTPRSSELINIFRGLEKLYWGAFRHWATLLTPGANLVVIFPRVHADNGQIFTLDTLLDKLASLGYNKRSCDLFYARPQAVVEREIVVFNYEPKKFER